MGNASALLPSTFVGLVLGGLAVFVDEATLPNVVVVLSSSGLSWGAGALLMGALSPTMRWSSIAGATTLVVAVVAYYSINHLFGIRAATGDALSRAGLIWTAVGVVGGSVLGGLGWYLRFGDDGKRGMTAGALSGILMGQGVAWAFRYGLTPHPVFTPALVLPLALFVLLCKARPTGPGLGAFVLSAGMSAAVLAWAQAAA